MFANGPAPVAIAAITQDRALIGLLRSTVDPSNDLILVTSEAELTPHLNSRRVSAALLDSMFIEGDLAGRSGGTWRKAGAVSLQWTRRSGVTRLGRRCNNTPPGSGRRVVGEFVHS